MYVRCWVWLVCISGVITFSSCGGSKSLTSGKSPAGPRSEATVFYDAMIANDNYTWYTGKARIKATTPHEKVSATLNLRILRDSVIWATIDKLGFEIARVLITPDSVLVVDRLNKEYTKKSLPAFLLEYNVNVGFSDLQNALIGRMIALSPIYVESKPEEELELLIVSDHAGVTARHWFTRTLPHRLMRSYIVDAAGRKLQIENAGWETYGDGSEVPYGRLLTFEDTDGLTEIEIIFSEITKNVPANIPFSIPAHYAVAR
jgi:hypothetical protein